MRIQLLFCVSLCDISSLTFVAENCNNKESIHSVIVALDSDTKLDFSNSHDESERMTFYLNGPGSLFWFHGRQLHGGCNYEDKPNVRLHFYVHYDQNVIDYFTKGYRASLYACEYGCGKVFNSKLKRSRHYRRMHPYWWEEFKFLRSEEKKENYEKKQIEYNRKYREKKKRTRVTSL